METMGSAMEEITAKFRRERVRWSDEMAVLTCETADGHEIGVICPCKSGELHQGLTYCFSGSSEVSERFGRQFRASCWAADVPVTKDAVIFFLQQFHGIGPATARALYAEYGENTLIMLATFSHILEHYRIKPEAAIEISQTIKETLSKSKSMIEIANYLHGYHFPTELPEKVYQRFGVKTLQVLKLNPYLLLEYERCGFLTVDAFALDKGYNPKRLKRQALFLLYQMKNSEDSWHDVHGRCWSWLYNQFGSSVNFRKVLTLLKRSHRIDWKKTGDIFWLATREDSENEKRVAALVRSTVRALDRVRLDQGDLSESQYHALLVATSRRVGCLTGGPGTGKTFTIARYIQAVCDAYGERNVCVVAPTGKAVIRNREMLKDIDVKCPSCTIHSLLWHQATDSIRYDFLICDEASMIDAGLMRRLLEMNQDSNILFVGDDGQLLPVGKGKPFADILASCAVPVGRLYETRRNSGRIVETCHAIRDGRPWSFTTQADIANGENLVYVPSADYVETIMQIVRRHHFAPDGTRDFQVIASTNRGVCGIETLNETLRPLLNPGCDLSVKYSENDPVMCLKNGLYKSVNSTRDSYCSNGEIGRCLAVEKNLAIVDFGMDRIVRFRMDNANFQLAYAVTGHKMQGSEVPIAIVLLDPSYTARMVCKREWFYTAISRAKQLCYLVGNIQTARDYCRELGNKRKTFLKEILANEI